MQTLLQGIEVESRACGHHDLAIDDAAGGQTLRKQVVQLGKVSIERTQLAALNHHLPAVAKDQRAKAVPLRLEEEVTVRGQ